MGTVQVSNRFDLQWNQSILPDISIGAKQTVSITIQNLDERLVRRLRVLAPENGRSIEEEARNILCTALACESAKVMKLGTAMHRLFKPFGGAELKIPPRELMSEPPRFD